MDEKNFVVVYEALDQDTHKLEKRSRVIQGTSVRDVLDKIINKTLTLRYYWDNNAILSIGEQK